MIPDHRNKPARPRKPLSSETKSLIAGRPGIRTEERKEIVAERIVRFIEQIEQTAAVSDGTSSARLAHRSTVRAFGKGLHG
jgi:hypothetical protein